jgi:hypothetical protein
MSELIDTIIEEVAASRNINPAYFYVRQKTTETSYALHEVYYRIRVEAALPVTHIAAIFNTDPSTVRHGIGRHYAMQNDISIKNDRRLARYAKAVIPNPVSTVLQFDYTPRSRPTALEMQKLPPMKKKTIVDLHIDKQEFVARHIAGGGTAHEALEPFGFSRGASHQFVKRFLPSLLGIDIVTNVATRKDRTDMTLARIAKGKRWARGWFGIDGRPS